MTSIVPRGTLTALPPNLGRLLSLSADSWVAVLYDAVGEPWHERYLLFEDDEAGFWWVMGPDRDVFREWLSLPGRGIKNIVSLGIRRALPSALGADAGQPVYRFVRSPSGESISKAKEVARRLAAGIVRAPPGGLVPSAPTTRRLRGKGPVADDATGAARGGDTSLPWSRPGMIWRALAAVADVCAAGDMVPATDGGWVGAEFGVALVSGIEVPVRLVTVGCEEIFINSMRDSWDDAERTPVGDPGIEALERKLADALAGQALAEEGLKNAELDVRILSHFEDGENERYRPFAESVAMMYEEDFTYKEMPTKIPRVALWWLKDLKRDATTPVRHHHVWTREAEIEHRDRTFHEHECLSEIAEAFVCVDQLNCGSLWGFEKLIRRIMVLEEAHSAPGKPPNWDGAELWTESRPRGAGRINPSLQQHVTTKRGERNAVEKEKRKAQEIKLLQRKKPDKPDKPGKGKGKDAVAATGGE